MAQLPNGPTLSPWRAQKQYAKVVSAVVCCSCSVLFLTAEGQRPEFRATTDLVRLDVTVQDRDGRPIHDLTADSFAIFDGRSRRPVEHFFSSWVAQADEGLDESARSRGDIATNDWVDRRPTIVLLDDANMRFDPGVAQTARRVAHTIIDDMRAGDLGAVVFSYLGRSTGLTADRTVLHTAVESLIPHPSPLACGFRSGGCEVAAMRGLTDNLAGLGTSRKLLFLIGSSRRLAGPDTPVQAYQELFQRLHRYNWVVYAVDPEGIQTLAATAESRAAARVTLVHNDSLRAFSEATGGRVVSSNDSWTSVPELLRENDAVYTLGFRPERRMDGKFHPVRVEVRVPGAVVRGPRGYFASDGPGPTATAPLSLEAVLHGPLPVGTIRLELQAAPLALDPRDPELVVVGRTIPGAPEGQNPFPRDFIVTAFRLPHYDVERTFRGAWPPRASPGSAPPEVASRLKVRPGMYEVRLGAGSGSDMGTVFATVEVPDFEDGRLSMSGLMFETLAEGSSFANVDMNAVTAITPTAVRSFPLGSRFRGVAAVYKARSVHGVTVECLVSDELGGVVRRRAQTFAAADFNARGFVSVAVDPQSVSLPAGWYRFSVAARSGEETVERTSSFRVHAK